MEQLIIKGDPVLLDRVRSLVGGWDSVLVDAPDEQTARLGKLSIRRGDPTVDISALPGIWADRDDLTLDTLRERAWGYRRRR